MQIVVGHVLCFRTQKTIITVIRIELSLSLYLLYTQNSDLNCPHIFCVMTLCQRKVKAGMFGNKWAKVPYAVTYSMKIPLQAGRKRVRGLKMPVVEGKWTCLTVQ